jgi:hypothetical protein
LEYTTPAVLTNETLGDASWADENLVATSWFDECLWKSYTWEDGEYQDDIDEVGPDDSGEYAFP